MRYRTRKYILAFLRTGFLLAVVAVLYTAAAQQKKLPALFEKYTGQAVRQATGPWYLRFWPQERPLADYLRVWLDQLTREPGFLAQQAAEKDFLANLERYPRLQAGPFWQLKTDPVFINWLSAPAGPFADVYRYQFQRQLQAYGYLQNLQVLDQNRKIVFQLHDQPRLAAPPADLTEQISRQGFSLPVFAGPRLIGYLAGSWNFWQFPELPLFNQPAGNLLALALDHSGQLLNHGDLLKANQVLNPLLDNSSGRHLYQGPLAGTWSNLRFYSVHTDFGHMLFVYPAASPAFYLLRLGGLLLALAAIMALYYFYRQKAAYQGSDDWLENALKDAVSVNQRALAVSRQQQRVFFQIKEAEHKRLENIAAHLARLQTLGSQEIPPLPKSGRQSVRQLARQILSKSESQPLFLEEDPAQNRVLIAENS